MSKRNPDIEATEPDTPVSRRSTSSKSDLTNDAEHNEFPDQLLALSPKLLIHS
jgi:hypothetical protein